MSIRNKAIFLVMFTITGMAAIFYYYFYTGHQRAYDQNIRFMSTQMEQFIENGKKTLKKTYLPRMRGFINTNPGIIETFKQRDRERLLDLTLPKFKVLKEENEFLYGFTYILPDYTILLRMQQPEFFGDSVRSIPFARHVLGNKKTSLGFSITKIGAYYRIVVPVYENERLIGAIGWAFDLSLLAQSIQKSFPISYGIFVNSKRYKALTRVKSEPIEIGNHVLITADRDTDIFSSLPPGFDLHKKNQIVSIKEKILIINSNPLQNFADEHMGDILLSLDITDETALFHRQKVTAAVLTLTVLVLSFLVLYFSFGAMINRVEQLNKTLEQRVVKRTLELSEVNKELSNEIFEKQKIEQKQEELIKQLQKALNEVKMLNGLLPICAHCKKIRDDKGYWNQIEGYIQKYSDATFSHGICPECSEKFYSREDWYMDMKNKKKKD